MPTKGNVRRITSTIPYNKKIRLYRGKIRESEKAEDFASGSARNSASLWLPVSFYRLGGAFACRGEPYATPLVIDKHTPRCQIQKNKRSRIS